MSQLEMGVRTPRPVTLCYIHGFLSGSTAAKAKTLAAYIQEHGDSLGDFKFAAPDFPDTPQEAYAALRAFCRELQAAEPERLIVLVGSSMGGFFSSLLGAEFNCKMVLLNPCTHPQDYFHYLVGPQFNEMTGTHFELKSEMITFLRELDTAIVVRPELTRVYLGSCDQTLDWRKSMLRYNACDIQFVPGEDHAFTHNFAALIPSIMDFALAR